MLTKAQLLSAASGAGSGDVVPIPIKEHGDFLRAYQASMVGGTAAQVLIEVSLDSKGWARLAIITLGADETDGTSSAVPWRFARATVLSVTGGGLIDAMVVTGSSG